MSRSFKGRERQYMADYMRKWRARQKEQREAVRGPVYEVLETVGNDAHCSRCGLELGFRLPSRGARKFCGECVEEIARLMQRRHVATNAGQRTREQSGGRDA